MEPVKVALLQIMHHGRDWRENMKTGEMYCRKAKELGADIALFPEMWNIGYSFPTEGIQVETFPYAGSSADPEFTRELGELAIDKNHEFLSHFIHLAQTLDMSIAITYLEKWREKQRNSVSLIDRFGKILFTYAKVHTCAFDLNEYHLQPGEEFYVETLNTVKGDVKVGAMICFDREFPESARLLMLKGAEIILVPNACPMSEIRVCLLKARAFENMTGIALANYPAPFADGHSMAVNGMAFDEKENPTDMTVAQSDENEQIIIAEFDMEKMRIYRDREVWGNKYRRPQAYKDLISKINRK